LFLTFQFNNEITKRLADLILKGPQKGSTSYTISAIIAYQAPPKIKRLSLKTVRAPTANHQQRGNKQKIDKQQLLLS
jgi:hypothetical protein